MRSFFGLSILAGLVSLVAGEHGANAAHRRHHDLARRVPGDVQVHKRDSFTNARFTFYDVGLGACGKTNVASDFIVALTTLQFGGGFPGPNCFKMITIQANGKTAQAQIMDECMGCPWGGLDFSRGLFDFFADESAGVISGTWWFNDDAPAPTTTKQSSTWTPPSSTWTPPSSTWSPPPSSTWTPPSSTWTPSSSSTWSSSSSSSWSSSSSSSSTSTSHSTSSTVSSSTSSAPAATSSAIGVLNSMNQAIMGMSGLVAAGGAN